MKHYKRIGSHGARTSELRDAGVIYTNHKAVYGKGRNGY
jgi:hypothetical protein